MILRHLPSIVVLLFFAFIRAADKPRPEPVLRSVFPVGVQQGESVEVGLLGQHLEDTRELWFDCEALEGNISGVKKLGSATEGDQSKPKEEWKVVLKIKARKQAQPGVHAFRIISRHGVSNALPLVVHSEPLFLESALPRQEGSLHRRLSRPPVAVSGTINEPGEVDFYLFEADSGTEWLFETFPASRTFDPELTLYAFGSSWFNPDRLERLAFLDDPNTAMRELNPKLRYRFSKTGRYLLAVNGFLGRGGADFSYNLRVTCAGDRFETIFRPVHSESEWQERDFLRKLSRDRLDLLLSRTVENQKGIKDKQTPALNNSNGSLSTIGSFPEREPNDAIAEAANISVPQLVEGKIERPRDTDVFKFTIGDQARLAIEIETPQAPAPFFTPRIGIRDETGREVVNNVYALIQGSGEFIEKVIEPKVTFNFQKGGEYWLQVQDLTARHGGPGFQYRILVRPQIPHMGRIEAAQSFQKSFDGSIKKVGSADRLNLTPGEAKKLAVLTEQEEGFDGQIALFVENLPSGVQAHAATAAEPERPPILDEGKKERFRPTSQIATLVFMASPDAPRTKRPQTARIFARPVVNGRVGPRILVQEVLVMVIQGQSVGAHGVRPQAQSP